LTTLYIGRITKGNVKARTLLSVEIEQRIEYFINYPPEFKGVLESEIIFNLVDEKF
jgi:hypothetical protein